MPGRKQDRFPNPIPRRAFLLAAGGAALGAAATSPASAASALAQGRGSPPDRFTRMFRLRPFAEPSDQVERALTELGAPGGLMDAKDPLHQGPILLITNPGLSPNNLDSSVNTAGMTFLGQFLDHDMTFDTTSRLGVPTPPERSLNSRTPALDLDSVYGGGPIVDPRLYDSTDRIKFKVESGGLFEDLPRAADGSAIISDPRNDENLMISGLQSAMLLFHNRVVDWVRQNSLSPRRNESVFDEARRLVTWHYQWIIVNEFLPGIAGSALVNDVLLRGSRFYTPPRGQQRIPVEFQAAAYRFGHSMVRPSYRANLAGDLGQPFFGFIFDPAGQGQSDPVDLRGGARASRRFIGWQTFFNFGGSEAANVRPSKVIDTKISTPLFNLPLQAIASGDPPTSLPQRNLLRHLTWSLPSGQAIAAAMGIPALSPSQLAELKQFSVGFENSTPLWYYILKEAEVSGGGRLAGVGARIVTEVFIELIRLDVDSYLSQPAWRPTLPSRNPGTFNVVDLLTFAGVDPRSRQQ